MAPVCRSTSAWSCCSQPTVPGRVHISFTREDPRDTPPLGVCRARSWKDGSAFWPDRRLVILLTTACVGLGDIVPLPAFVDCSVLYWLNSRLHTICTPLRMPTQHCASIVATATCGYGQWLHPHSMMATGGLVGYRMWLQMWLHPPSMLATGGWVGYGQWPPRLRSRWEFRGLRQERTCS